MVGPRPCPRAPGSASFLATAAGLFGALALVSLLVS